jgi:hypothetical protein
MTPTPLRYVHFDHVLDLSLLLASIGMCAEYPVSNPKCLPG